jgi:catechol 2,3-dioxygenase-like lactoylglutathione lyase family enzyme
MFRSSRDLIIRVPAERWAEALRFYERVLGFAPGARADDMAGFESGALQLFVERGSAHAAVLELLVPDVAAARARLLECGCTLIEEDPQRPRCYLRDPYGLTFNIARSSCE